MKTISVIILCFILPVLVFTSCSTIAGGTPESNEELYKAAIERYYNSLLQLDIDSFLDSLDPRGPLYPDADTIDQMRAEADTSSLAGEVVVNELMILEESNNWVRVKAELFMSIDFSNSGEPFEETIYPTFELTLIDGKWRVFNGSLE